MYQGRFITDVQKGEERSRPSLTVGEQPADQTHDKKFRATPLVSSYIMSPSG